MNAEQKKRIAHEISNWKNACNCRAVQLAGDRMAALLNELLAATNPAQISSLAEPQPPRLSDGRILEIGAMAKAQWNAAADQYNQWRELDSDEITILIARAIEREILGAPSVPDMPLSMEQFGGLVGLDRDDASEEAIAYKATKLKAVTEQRDKLLEALGLAADMLDMIGQHPQTVANIRRIIAAT